MQQDTYITRMMRWAAVGQLISAAESLSRLSDFAPRSLLRGRAHENTSSVLPASARRAVDTSQGAAGIQLASLVAGGLALIGRPSRRRLIAASAMSLASAKVFETRNPYGRDGSDQLQAVIHGYRVLTAVVPDARRSDDLFLRAVNAQTCVSYAASGLAKLISSDWRSGRSMAMILRTDVYGGTWFARLVNDHPWMGRGISWSTIAWECAYPVVYVLAPARARQMLLVVKGFHLGVAYSMGLPRFFWAFGAAHPATEYVIDRRGAHAV